MSWETWPLFVRCEREILVVVLSQEVVMIEKSRDALADEVVREETKMKHPCPRCETDGSVDFFDLVRGVASMHCPACPTAWTVETEAPYAALSRR